MVTVSSETPSSGKSRKELIEDLKQHHVRGLAELGVTDFYFAPKMKFVHKERTVINLFPSEVESKQDLYLEFVNREFEATDEARTLYKFKHNPHYKEEYETRAISTGLGYVIPISDLEEILLPMDDAADDRVEFDIDLPDGEKTNITMMTVEDYAAIHLRAPISGRPWLDDVIRKLNSNK